MAYLIFGSLVCLVSSFFDGVRDSGVGRWADWGEWHIVKWISFYSALSAVVFLCWRCSGYPWEWGLASWVIVLAVVCRVVWKAGNTAKFFGERAKQ